MRFLPRFSASLACATVLLSAAAPASAQLQDSAPVDLSSLLRELKQIREQQSAQLKQQRQQAIQQATAAAASGERAVAIWEDAVRAIQFEGATREGTAFKEWKDREGDGLNSKEGRNAARLFFAWMALTLQRDSGVPVKDLLPQVVGYTKELSLDREMMEALDERIKRDRELNASGRHGMKRSGDEDKVKRMHDQILNKGLAASPVAQLWRIGDFLKPEKWENNPGDYNGIFNQIILPELRAQRDPRLLEYWDMRLKREADNAAKQKLAFDLDRYNNQRRPSLLWSRAEDILLLGQRNRAIGEMFGIVRNFPNHPELVTWIGRLETILAPPAPAIAPVPPATPPAPSAQDAPATSALVPAAAEVVR